MCESVWTLWLSSQEIVFLFVCLSFFLFLFLCFFFFLFVFLVSLFVSLFCGCSVFVYVFFCFLFLFFPEQKFYFLGFSLRFKEGTRNTQSVTRPARPPGPESQMTPRKFRNFRTMPRNRKSSIAKCCFSNRNRSRFFQKARKFRHFRKMPRNRKRSIHCKVLFFQKEITAFFFRKQKLKRTF